MVQVGTSVPRNCTLWYHIQWIFLWRVKDDRIVHCKEDSEVFSRQGLKAQGEHEFQKYFPPVERHYAQFVKSRTRLFCAATIKIILFIQGAVFQHFNAFGPFTIFWCIITSLQFYIDIKYEISLRWLKRSF